MSGREHIALRRLRFVAGAVLGSALLFLPAALVAADGAKKSDPADLRNPVVYPPQSIPLHFSHKKHLKLGVQCALCHGGIESSEQPMGHPLPDHEQCGICHLMNAPNPELLYPKATCATCHKGYVEGRDPLPVIAPPANLTFAHKTHIDAGVECASCHGDMKEVELATVAQLPRMKTCVDCHKDNDVSVECAACHLDKTGRLLTDLGAEQGRFKPSGAHMPDDHGLGWMESHAPAARMDPQRCQACHTVQSCLDCHDAVGKPWQVHSGDWILLHPRRARNDAGSCQSCHRTETFCQDCHRAVGIHASDPAQPDGRGVHPPGWTDLPRTRNHHSFAAQRNMAQCSACHEPDTCARCHATTVQNGFGVSPHGPDFKARRLYRRNPASCYACHAPDDPKLTALERER